MKTVAPPDIRVIPIAQLHESPLNTRRHFDAHKLEELAASMKASGQLAPCLARPSTLPNLPGFELAAGHRRRRAAPMAGLDSLMVIVRDLDDRTFLEILTIDNLQREDVHPLEEAQGYRNLLTIDGYDPKQIAERVGKSESYVYDRLKLLQLIPEFQELFFASRFSLGHAILLARVGASVQKELLEEEMGGGFWRPDFGHATLGLLNPEKEEGPYAGQRPASVRELQGWIDDHVRFNPSDESVPQLFAATAETLAKAEAQRAKVVAVTYSFHVHPDAKDADGSRTYSPQSWKRADGEPGSPQYGEEGKPTQTCDHSVVGLVAAGEHRGESFLVCIDKKRCTVHWGDEIKARNKREREKEKGETSTSSKAAPNEQSWERDDRLRKERLARAKERWEKGGDAILRAIAPSVKKLAVGGNSPATEYFLGVLEDGLHGMADGGKHAAKLGIPRGTTPADLMRHVIMVSLLDRAEPGSWNATNEKDLQEDLDALKIKVNVAKLLDAANPAPAKTAAPAKVAKAKKARAK